jgi:hypothetical protein
LADLPDPLAGLMVFRRTSNLLDLEEIGYFIDHATVLLSIFNNPTLPDPVQPKTPNARLMGSQPPIQAFQ